ncbi:MAG: dienelactone hydrolase family protein, partial [Chloroflexota bacterium]
MPVFLTDQTEATLAETVTITGANGDQVGAYVARPLGPGSYPAVVLLHSAPGWGDFYHEATMRFARRGYIAICPNLYHRFGHGTAADVGAKAREAGGTPDTNVVGDVQGAIAHVRGISGHNGKIGVIGGCSGGRHSFLIATSLPDQVHAAVDLWGGNVVAKPEDLTPGRPVNLVTQTSKLQAPLLGIFGNEDANPSPEAVNALEVALKAEGKTYAFHRYDGVGHGFMHNDGAAYRAVQ